MRSVRLRQNVAGALVGVIVGSLCAAGGPFGSACDLGQEAVRVEANPAFSSRPLTVECWVRLTDQERYNIIAANETKKSPCHWELFSLPQTGCFAAYLSGSGVFRTTVCITDGDWHALAMVLDGQVLQLYVDGNLELERQVREPTGAALGEELCFGRLVENKLGCSGEIDEVRISSVARSIDGILSGPFEADDQTAGLWHFDDDAPVANAETDGLNLAKGLVQVPVAAEFRQRPLTIDCWMKLPEWKNTDIAWQDRGHQVLLAYGRAHEVPSPDFWQLDVMNGNVRFMAPGPQMLQTRAYISDDQWHHLAVVMEEEQVRLLVDGKEEISRRVMIPVQFDDECPVCRPAEWITIGGLQSGLRRGKGGEIRALRISKGVRDFKRVPETLDADAQTLAVCQFDSSAQSEWPERTGKAGVARVDWKPIGPSSEFQPLPEPVPAKPLKQLATEFAAKLKLKSIDPAAVEESVWRQWHFDYHWHGKFDYDRIARYWDDKKVQGEAFDRNALVWPEDGDAAGTALRRTRALIEHLRKMDDAPVAKLDQLAADLEKIASAHAVASDPQRKLACYLAASAVRREAAFCNPLLDFDSILCVARGTYEGSVRSNPITTDHQGGHFSTQYFGFNALAGGGLYIVKNWKDAPVVTDVLEHSVVESGPLKGQKLENGAFCTPDLSYDGKQIVFAWTANPDHTWSFSEKRMFHLFKVNVDGTGLTQLTEGGYNDFDPCWMPDGRISFISERRGGHIRCFGPNSKVRNYTLFSMKADGSDMFPLSYYETSEWNPSVNNDGMLVYTRWDYTDRENCLGSRFWISGPDGTDPRAPHGNYPEPFHTFPDYKPWKVLPNGEELDSRVYSPVTEMGIRAIPGSHRYIFTGAPHHGQVYGSLGILDLQVEDDNHMSQIKRITPDEAYPEMEFFARRHYKYGTPWPLSEDFYLCNIWDDIALLDRYGNAEQICDLREVPGPQDERMRLIDPIPLRARPRPSIIPGRTNQGEDAIENAPKATLAVMNVYDSDLPFPEGRKVKWLRIVQNILKSNHAMNRPKIGYQAENTPRIPLGIVPVEEDGSAYFEAPVAKELIFQALDEDFMAIQSMRSVAFVHPGEQLSCQGCHEPKNRPPVMQRTPLAVQRAPSKIHPEIGTVEPISYYRQIKPIFENTCVSCHQKQGKGPIDMSYDALKDDTFWFAGGMSRRMIAKDSGIHGGSRSIPGRFGASYCNIGRALMDETHLKAVSEEDRHKIIVWLDCNSLRYSAFIREEEQLRGELVWPTLDVDPANPLGVEGTEPALKHNFWHENVWGPHAFLGGSHASRTVYLMNEQGEVVWSAPARNPQDVWMLPNGHVLVATLHAVQEIDRDQNVVWEYAVEEPDQIPTCQPLPDGNVLIGIVGQCRLIEVNRNKEIVHSVQLSTTIEKPHAQFRMCRKTPEGTYLVPFAAEGALREYDRDGNVIREFPKQRKPLCAVRLPTGNTLVTAEECITEFGENDEIVWQVTPDDIPDIKINVLAGVQRLPAGNTLVCNWGSADQVNVNVFEITPDKRVVWKVNTDKVTNVAQCQVLTTDLMPRADIVLR